MRSGESDTVVSAEFHNASWELVENVGEVYVTYGQRHPWFDASRSTNLIFNGLHRCSILKYYIRSYVYVYNRFALSLR